MRLSSPAPHIIVIIVGLIATIGLLPTLFVTSAATADVRLLQQRADLLRLAYRPDAEGVATPPCAHKILVGIPPKGDVSLSVVETVLTPSATSGPVADACAPSSHSEPAFLGPTGLLREQRVIELWFAGLGPDASVYEEIVVDLHLPPAESDAEPRLDPFAEELYAGAVVNYEQARRWRRGPAPVARPKSFARMHRQALKISLRQTGIYQVFGADLQKAGVDLGTISPHEIALLYGGGRPLPLENSDAPGSELRAVEILLDDGGDGRFDPQDSFLFYGESLSRWVRDPDTGDFEYLFNPYSHTNVYWLFPSGEDDAARGTVRPSSSGTASITTDTYRVRLHQETETATTFVALGNIASGSEWYWEDFRAGDTETFGLVIRRPAAGPTTIRLRFVARTESTRRFNVAWNNRRVGSARFETVAPHLFEFTTSISPTDGVNELTLENTSGTLSLFDWYELEFDRQLEAERDELFFDAADNSGLVEYQLGGFTDEETPRLFDVSGGFDEIIDFAHDPATGTVVFADTAGPAQSYVALTSSRMKTPNRIEAIDQTDLKLGSVFGADYLIISHADFLDEADRLAAWRASDNRFGPAVSTAVVDIQEIYDTFSAGLLDPTAIRDFVRHTTSNWDPVPFFVLLFGDGSYDYKNNSGTSTGNWIPPYEDEDLTYDDWYVSVFGEDELPDMAIGRLPVQTVIDARTVVDKLIDYDADPEVGDWQARSLLVVDDTFNADDRTRVEIEFIRDSEEFASRFLPADVDVEKLYLLEFPLEGRFKPRARDAFVERFNAGAVLLVYIGHGNSRVFAHEHIFVLPTDLEEIANDRRLPFLYTAASQMAVFDDPLRDSIPEAFLKLSGGGVIGMIGATRVGFHLSNMILARSFHDVMFRSGRQHVPVGLGLMEAKAIAPADILKILRYNLFGDPLTRLAFPAHAVHLDTAADTLRALGEVRVTGRLTDKGGTLLEDFSGQVHVHVFDSTTRRVLADRGTSIEYEKPGAPIFRGLLPVVDGRFETVFRVPKDITYGANEGRMTAYAWDGQVSAYGAAGPFAFSGTDESAPPDKEGPEIEFTLDGRLPTDEKQLLEVAPTALLRARLRDPGGINITGEIGHRIDLRIDGEVTDVTQRYEALTDYREGSLQIRLPSLEPGEHMLRLEAWDTYNNWAEKRLDFQVTDAVDALSQVLFHPNPMRDEGGFFTFSLSHASDTVRIRVFSVAGRLVAELQGTGSQGYNQIAWHPNQELANGTYLFEISARGLDSASSSREKGSIQVVR